MGRKKAPEVRQEEEVAQSVVVEMPPKEEKKRNNSGWLGPSNEQWMHRHRPREMVPSKRVKKLFRHREGVKRLALASKDPVCQQWFANKRRKPAERQRAA